MVERGRELRVGVPGRTGESGSGMRGNMKSREGVEGGSRKE